MVAGNDLVSEVEAGKWKASSISASPDEGPVDGRSIAPGPDGGPVEGGPIDEGPIDEDTLKSICEQFGILCD